MSWTPSAVFVWGAPGDPWKSLGWAVGSVVPPMAFSRKSFPSLYIHPEHRVYRRPPVSLISPHPDMFVEVPWEGHVYGL